MKILITNTVVLNGGDAAILQGILTLLRQAFGEKTEFVVYDSQPEVAGRYYPDLTFRKSLYSHVARSFRIRLLSDVLRWINQGRFYLAVWCWNHVRSVTKVLLKGEELRELSEYSSADLIVSTGGTYLVEHYSLVPRIFDYNVSLSLGKPLVFFTQSLGPFMDSRNRSALRKIFQEALVILLRDELSWNHLRDLNIDEHKLYISSDAAFALGHESVLKNACVQDLPKGPCLKVAISVRQWEHFESVTREAGMKQYRNALRAATQMLVECYEAEITYISTCQGVPEYWLDDSRVAMKIVNGLPLEVQKHVEIDEKFYTVENLMTKLEQYDFVIATRMHMAILALVVGVPVLPIAYEFKTEELFKRLGLEQWVQNIESIDPKSLVTSIERFLSVIPEIRPMLVRQVLRERARALGSSMIVRRAFEEWSEK